MPTEVPVILEVILKVAVALFCFGFTIFVHELGHFWVARKLGLQVDAFSIGFGPALFKKKVNGILYKIGIFPLGGYVALPQMDHSALEATDASTDPAAAPPPPPVEPWKRLVVALAGVTMNMILAVILATVIWKVGILDEPTRSTIEIGYIEPGSPAETAGLKLGDRILEANGRKIETWKNLQIELALRGVVDLKVQRGADVINLQAETVQVAPMVRTLPGFDIAGQVHISDIVKDMPAVAAGFMVGDEVLKVDGQPVSSRAHVIELVRACGGREMVFTVFRALTQKTLDLRVTPALMKVSSGDPAQPEPETVYMVGVAFKTLAMTHPTPWEQIRLFSGALFRTLRALTDTREQEYAAKGIAGPVYIFTVFYKIATSNWMALLSLVALVNVNLAIMNLLPIPILDGGHVVFCLSEMATRRRPNRRFVAVVSNAFALTLLALMIFLVYRDIRVNIPALNEATRPVPAAPVPERVPPPVEVPAAP